MLSELGLHDGDIRPFLEIDRLTFHELIRQPQPSTVGGAAEFCGPVGPSQFPRERIFLLLRWLIRNSDHPDIFFQVVPPQEEPGAKDGAPKRKIIAEITHFDVVCFSKIDCFGRNFRPSRPRFHGALDL